VALRPRRFAELRAAGGQSSTSTRTTSASSRSTATSGKVSSSSISTGSPCSR
jgi:hypothetical protein